MTSSRQALGRWGETLAADFLIQKGHNIFERNLRTSYGEIDLIARDGKYLEFMEVKARSSDVYGLPEASNTHQKCQHLIAASQAYLQTLLNSDTD